jgi:hypothetical protein
MPPGRLAARLFPWLSRWLRARGLEVVRRVNLGPKSRAYGRDWPVEAEPMIGWKRLGAVADCRAAVDDYRSRQGAAEPPESVDWTGVFWRRAR